MKEQEEDIYDPIKISESHYYRLKQENKHHFTENIIRTVFSESRPLKCEVE